MDSLEEREEHYRRELKTLVETVSLGFAGFPMGLVAGRKKDGSVSIYVGIDYWVLHFNPAGELKRIHHKDNMYRTQGTTLAQLTRERTPDATILHRRDLNEEELEHLKKQARGYIELFPGNLQKDHPGTLRFTKPAENFPLDDFREFFENVLERDIPLAPAFKGKK